jgi:hypothetical protein
MIRLSCHAPIRVLFLFTIACLAGAHSVKAQADSLDDPKLTEIYDPALEPKVVTPGATCNDAPSDAIILFNGTNQNEWVSAKDHTSPSDWVISNGELTVNKTAGTIQTKRKFGNYQLHVEWKIPVDIAGEGQERGNSGVFLADPGPGEKGYELQVLDNYNNKTYFNGMVGSIYKQAIPLANAARKPGQWQSYDVIWTAPLFNSDGSLASPARITAFHNGVLVENNFALKGITRWRGKPYYKAHGPAPIELQAHGDKSKPISYRNIWVRPL